MTANEIRLASTMVQSGAAASLLSESPTGMKAVVDKVNAQGGICGRALKLTLRDDGFNEQLGHQYIRNFIEEDYFALAVVPSAEGLGAAINSGVIEKEGIPVVGTDGLRQEQYGNPWVWPVATATVSTMRIMADYAYRKQGARTFAIVWDSRYKFGREGKDAFEAQVNALPGAKMVYDQKLSPDSPAYTTEVNEFNNRCGNQACDMVALLLLPGTAQKWMSRKPAMGAKYTAGAQTLFTDDFGQQCANSAGVLCNGIAVWTGYNPPIDRYEGIPEVAEYVSDVKGVSPRADVRNQFLEGSYLGMTVLVEALKRVGPDLTRQRLKAVLDAMTFPAGITAGLKWRPGAHYANTKARSFSIVISDGRFLGWRDEQTGWVQDPAFRS